jgi:glutamate-ammonia-ligase adenylyltransferase
LQARVMAIVRATLTRPRDAARILAEVADMRGRMDRERRSRGPWDLKLAAGGFVDIEFITQALQLTHAAAAPRVLAANTGEALERLTAAGALDQATGDRLVDAWRVLSDLQQMLRIAMDGDFTPDSVSPPLLARVATILGAEAADGAEPHLLSLQQKVRADFVQIVGVPGDGSAPLARS